MIFAALLCLLLTNLVGVSSQQTDCTREGFQAIAVERVFDSAASEATDPSDIFINATYYNCLATSETIGEYTTMSVSLLYTILSAPDTLREIRYVMLCIGGVWNRQVENNTALRRNDTRTDCYECTDTADNEDYCSPCDSSCTGLNQCYGANATQCCSYNDDGNCVADCGMNREGNATLDFQCVCSNFWIGADCDNCSLNCENGGTPESDCSVCQCIQGYEGMTCGTDIDECDPNPCQNGGVCNDGVDSYNCTCLAGYNGTNCENNTDDCSPNPCQNGGTCSDLINNYTCACDSAYFGHNCSEEVPEEENADSDGLSAGAIFGIVLACIAALLVLIIITVAIIFALHRQRTTDTTDGPKYTNPTYHKQTDEADLGDTTEDDGQAEKSPLANDNEATEL